MAIFKDNIYLSLTFPNILNYSVLIYYLCFDKLIKRSEDNLCKICLFFLFLLLHFQLIRFLYLNIVKEYFYCTLYLSLKVLHTYI